MDHDVRVLVVDDHDLFRSGLKTLLEEQGVNVVGEAANGQDAIRQASELAPDVVVMDLNMPGIDGFTAAKLIREREAASSAADASGRSRVPIIALTAHDAVNFRSRVLDAQMDDILSKPYSLEECTKVLRRWMPRADGDGIAAVATKPADRTPSPSVAANPAPVALLAPDRAPGASHGAVDAAAVAALKKLRGGTQSDLYSRLVDLFRTSSADPLTQLGIALNAGDLRAAAAVCHKLAASAGNVGGLAYAKQLRELEHLCAKGQGSGAGDIYQALQAAHAPLIDALVGHTMRASA